MRVRTSTSAGFACLPVFLALETAQAAHLYSRRPKTRSLVTAGERPEGSRLEKLEGQDWPNTKLCGGMESGARRFITFTPSDLFLLNFSFFLSFFLAEKKMLRHVQPILQNEGEAVEYKLDIS